MAQGYARASGKPGVVLVTSGPGATNVVTPMQDALSDGTPLVVFCGQVVTGAIGTDAFQEAGRHTNPPNNLIADCINRCRRYFEGVYEVECDGKKCGGATEANKGGL